MKKVETFYFTFGFGQFLLNGESASNCYVAIEADSMGEAREKMVEVYGLQWAFSYREEDKAKCIDRYNTRQVPFGS